MANNRSAYGSQVEGVVIMNDQLQVERPNLSVDGVVTVALKSGTHYTYRFATIRNGPLAGKRVVEMLRGPDNMEDYETWGLIFPRDDSRWDTKQPHAVIWIWKRFQTEAFLKHKMLLMGNAEAKVESWWQAGRCARCGRLLTTKESIEAGMGPVCRERIAN